MKTVTFRNGKGHTLKLNAKLTISDLVKMGMKKIVLIEKGRKLPPNWWQAQ